MIGGGRGAFIGAVHRIAAALDGEAELVAGCLSSDPARARASGADLGLAPERTYGTVAEFVRGEAARPTAERLDFVVIVTPNHAHFEPARLCLAAGFHVVCDKPLALTVAEARALRALVRRTGRLFALTHNYTGSAMVREARALVRAGRLGTLRKVVVEYPQGWLATRLEATGQKQAAWRTDPRRAGAAGCIGDIGTHAEHLVRYVTGLELAELCADLTAFVPGRALDDDGSILLRFHGGARGVLLASQISVGEENGLRLRVYGTKAGLEWRQESPDDLWLKPLAGPAELRRRGQPYNSAAARAATRLPPGHPEGYLESFANVYREFFRAVRAHRAGRATPRDCDFPTVDDGVAGLEFIAAAVRSSQRGARWVRLPRR
jgi:predicted dehydrogenase